MEQVLRYKTLAANGTSEFKDRGSKFLGYAFPVSGLTDIKDKLQSLKKEHPKAVHYCYAYRLGTEGILYRANDDGEPAGSAGKPILGQIDSAGLTNILIVIVRYFGGTLLGVPGLINAYKTAAADALNGTAITEKWVEDTYNISFDYPVMGEVLYLLKQSEATIHKQELQLFCMVTAGIPRKNSETYLPKLSEIRSVTISKAKEE